jgi:hypothetical protein
VVQVTLQDRIERYSDAQFPDLQRLRDTIRISYLVPIPIRTSAGASKPLALSN